MQVLPAVEQCLQQLGATAKDDIIVAFSGGPDSSALLHAFALATGRRGITLHAVHVDHAMDPESAQRGERAAEIAARIGVPLTIGRISAIAARKSGESLEAAARRIRYRFLHREARRTGASWIATAHHADDQRETVLLRLLFGSGLAGLAGIPARRGRIIRPLLNVDRGEIQDYLAALDFAPVDDPSNASLDIPRNLIRHRLLPALEAEEEGIRSQLSSLASASRGAISRLDERFERLLCATRRDRAIRCERSAFDGLPESLRPHAVGALSRRIGAPPPTRAALSDLMSQVDRGSEIGCDLGSGWRLESRGRHLLLGEVEAATSPFAYTLRVPGEVFLSEVSLVFRLTKRPVEPWMFRGRRRKTGLSLSLREGETVTIRSRRPGDRLQPLGSHYSCRLKNMLIDRKMPKSERDRLPLLCVDRKIVWVPGVTIDESARLRDETEAWVAEIETRGRTENE